MGLPPNPSTQIPILRAIRDAVDSAGFDIFECNENTSATADHLVGRLGNFNILKTNTANAIGSVAGVGGVGLARQFANTTGVQNFQAATFQNQDLMGTTGGESFFVSMWMRSDGAFAAAPNNRVMSCGFAAPLGSWALVNSTGTLSLSYRISGSSTNTLTKAGMSVDNWYHVVFGYRSSDRRFWADFGTTSASLTWSSRVIAANAIGSGTVHDALVAVGAYTSPTPTTDSLRSHTIDNINLIPGDPGDYGTEQDVIDALWYGGEGVDWQTVDTYSPAGAGGVARIAGSGLGLGLGYD
jgi:hypothetical protein